MDPSKSNADDRPLAERRGAPPPLLWVLPLLIAACVILDGDGEQHQAGWDPERGPVIPHQSFPAKCDLCHVAKGWHRIKSDFQFDHAAETGHPLNGAHARAQCLRCHNDRGPVQQFSARSCAGCHVDPHENRLGTDCDRCHGESSWQPRGIMAEHALAGFPLIGVHTAISCDQCHPGARSQDFRGAPTECIQCHRDDAARVASPDHSQPGFTDCEECHRPFGWSTSLLAGGHSFFPLTGGHAGVDCTVCHQDNIYAGTSSACIACHQDDYESTVDPDHLAQGFSTDCEQCHDINAWGNATFAHTRWPLVGAHVAVDCNDCHGGGVFLGTPTDCYSCHQDDYLATTDPDHQAQGFSTDCEQCHSTSRWEGAVFDHPFPIDSGNHSGLDCNDCHTNPNDYTVFSCTSCHEHNQTDTDDDHDEVSGYVYLSSACYSCHPDGRE